MYEVMSFVYVSLSIECGLVFKPIQPTPVSASPYYNPRTIGLPQKPTADTHSFSTHAILACKSQSLPSCTHLLLIHHSLPSTHSTIINPARARAPPPRSCPSLPFIHTPPHPLHLKQKVQTTAARQRRHAPTQDPLRRPPLPPRLAHKLALRRVSHRRLPCIIPSWRRSIHALLRSVGALLIRRLLRRGVIVRLGAAVLALLQRRRRRAVVIRARELHVRGGRRLEEVLLRLRVRGVRGGVVGGRCVGVVFLGHGERVLMLLRRRRYLWICADVRLDLGGREGG